MNTEIIKAEDFGITAEKERELLKDLPQIKEERKVLENQYSEVIKLDIEDPETANIAKKLRLLIKTNRTQGIQTWHKNAKEFFLRGGQFCDAVKNIEIAVNERMEKALEEIEKHQELKEQKRIAGLQKERADMLRPYIENPDMMQMGTMDVDVFTPFYESKKKAFEDAEALKAQQEEDARIQKAKEKLFNERALMLAEFKGITEMELTIETLEQEFINEIERCKEIKAEKDAEAARILAEQQAKEALRKERAEELKPFIMFVTDYEGMLIAEPENYSQLFSEAKSKKEQHDIDEAKKKADNEAAQLKLMQDRLKIREERLFNIGAHKQSDQYFIDGIDGSVMSLRGIENFSDNDFERIFSGLKKLVDDFHAAEELKKQKAIEAAERKANRAPDKTKLSIAFKQLEFWLPAMKTDEGKAAADVIRKGFDTWVEHSKEIIDAL